MKGYVIANLSFLIANVDTVFKIFLRSGVVISGVTSQNRLPYNIPNIYSLVCKHSLSAIILVLMAKQILLLKLIKNMF